MYRIAEGSHRLCQRQLLCSRAGPLRWDGWRSAGSTLLRLLHLLLARPLNAVLLLAGPRCRRPWAAVKGRLRRRRRRRQRKGQPRLLG